MKKIFAIALAVVMVLSMASAFALSSCATWAPAWNCTVDDSVWCGQGKVEVVPYVKVNTACGWEFQVSDCAAAIRSTEVYFAVKVTAEAYPDADWWKEAVVAYETENLIPAWSFKVDKTAKGQFYNDASFDKDAEVEMVYYVDMKTGNLIDPANTDDVEGEGWEFDLKNVVYTSKVVDTTVACGETPAYNMCAKLTSKYDGYSVNGYNHYNDYVWDFSKIEGQKYWNDDEEMTAILSITDKDDAAKWVDLTIVDGAITGINWNKDEAAFYNNVMADFGFANCGTSACITKANVKAILGWDFEQKDCFDWSDKGASVVDTDCVVAIPKTGDASVLAWLF